MADFNKIFQQAGIPEEDRTVLEGLVAKYPNLDKLVVASDEYNVLKGNFDRIKPTYDGWEKFREEAWDAEHGMTRGEYKALQEAQTLRAQVATMAAGGIVTGEEQVDFAKLDEELKTRGYVRKEDVAAFSTEVEKKVGTQGANYEYLYTRTAHLPLRHMKEFGDVDGKLLPRIFEVMTSDPSGELLRDPDKAYEIAVGPMRLEQERKKLADDRAAFEKQQSDAVAARAAGPNPADTGGEASIPPYQMMTDKPGANPIDTMKGDSVFGSGQLGRNLADAYKKGELLKTVQ